MIAAGADQVMELAMRWHEKEDRKKERRVSVRGGSAAPALRQKRIQGNEIPARGRAFCRAVVL